MLYTTRSRPVDLFDGRIKVLLLKLITLSFTAYFLPFKNILACVFSSPFPCFVCCAFVCCTFPGFGSYLRIYRHNCTISIDTICLFCMNMILICVTRDVASVMATDAVRSQVAAKWQYAFSRLNRGEPGISGLVAFSQVGALITMRSAVPNHFVGTLGMVFGDGIHETKGHGLASRTDR